MNIRVPKRVVSYMQDTGWGQEAEAVSDPARVRLLREFSNKDGRGGLTLHDVDRPMLARLYFEAEHVQQGYLYGDHDNDTYADYRAGQKLQADIRALDSTIDFHSSRDLMYD